MIPQLACALYLEGSTDERFFVPLVPVRMTESWLLADVDWRDLYAPLGRRINLDRLQSVPSYGRFEAALTNALNGVV